MSLGYYERQLLDMVWENDLGLNPPEHRRQQEMMAERFGGELLPPRRRHIVTDTATLEEALAPFQRRQRDRHKDRNQGPRKRPH